MPLTDAQRAFIEGFVLRSAISDQPADPATSTKGTDNTEGGPKVLPIWNDAKESVDSGISSLQTALKTYKHPDLDVIADKGLNGVTKGNQVAMMKALLEFDATTSESRADRADALLKQLDAYRSFVTGDKIVALCEKNPFGVSVAIRAPLGVALDRIAAIAAG